MNELFFNYRGRQCSHFDRLKMAVSWSQDNSTKMEKPNYGKYKDLYIMQKYQNEFHTTLMEIR